MPQTAEAPTSYLGYATVAVSRLAEIPDLRLGIMCAVLVYRSRARSMLADIDEGWQGKRHKAGAHSERVNGWLAKKLCACREKLHQLNLVEEELKRYASGSKHTAEKRAVSRGLQRQKSTQV